MGAIRAQDEHLTVRSVEDRLSRRARRLGPAPIRGLMPYLAVPGMISLGGGYPHPDWFVLEGMDLLFRGGCRASLARDRLARASQYGPTNAHPDLGRALVEWHRAKDGVDLGEDEVVVLNGSQEGIFIASYLFLDEGDWVVAGEPLYPGARGAMGAFGGTIRTVSIDEEGLCTDELEELLTDAARRGEPRPKFIYDVPSGHNPTGATMSPRRRAHLLELASRFDVLIVEDDPYELLNLDLRPRPPTLQSLEWPRERVIRLDSFSKVLAPGLRLGYASGPAALMHQFSLCKQYLNLHTSTVMQEVVFAFLSTHGVEGFLRAIEGACDFSRRNRNAMVEAARRFLPADVRFSVPGWGLFVWFVLPAGLQAARMIRLDAADVAVVLVPGEAFAVRRDLSNCMRADDGTVSDEEITEGVRRFAVMIERERVRCVG